MKRAFSVSLAALISLGITQALAGQETSGGTTNPQESPLDYTVKTIEGEEINLAEKYNGKVLLVVNVASQCGMTPQYAGLQELHDTYHEKGLAVLGFPSNQFGEQEPGTNEQIATFCNDNYNVTFDLFSKVDVNGQDAIPLYAWLTKQEAGPAKSGDVAWNFEKFVIDRDGEVIARFSPRTEPDDPELVSTIEKALDEEKQ
jgi:glutathione peroxidase